MKSENFNLELLISEQAKNEIAIEMVVMHAIEHGILCTLSFIECSADRCLVEYTEETAYIFQAFSEVGTELSFNKIEDESKLTLHINALKDAM